MQCRDVLISARAIPGLLAVISSPLFGRKAAVGQPPSSVRTYRNRRSNVVRHTASLPLDGNTRESLVPAPAVPGEGRDLTRPGRRPSAWPAGTARQSPGCRGSRSPSASPRPWAATSADCLSGFGSAAVVSRRPAPRDGDRDNSPRGACSPTRAAGPAGPCPCGARRPGRRRGRSRPRPSS